jgi:hypothetical protein
VHASNASYRVKPSCGVIFWIAAAFRNPVASWSTRGWRTTVHGMSDLRSDSRRGLRLFARIASVALGLCVCACSRRHLVTSYADGTLDTDVEWSGRARDGHFVRYHDDGKKAVETHYRAGLREGAWLVWYADGTPAQEGRFVAGLHDGPWTEWNAAGKKVLTGTWRAGDKIGTWSEYDDEGALVATEVFEDGTLRTLTAAQAR